MGDGPTLASQRFRRMETSNEGSQLIIKPKRRADAIPLEKEVAMGGKHALATMMKSVIEDTQGANRALLCEFRIQEDVTTYAQLPECADFRGFDSANETDLAVISKRAYGGFATPSWPTLNRHLLMLLFRRNCFAP